LNELGESGRPLWDVEDDEFIVPSSQKRHDKAGQQGGAQDEDPASRRVSGGWQRLKNPFELQIDSQGSDKSSSQVTGEEAVVEVPENESLDESRSATADIDRKSIGGYVHPAQESDIAATSSTDSVDSFVEGSDSLEPEDAAPHLKEKESRRSRPHIVIGLEDAEENGDTDSGADGEPTLDEAPIDDALSEKPSGEAALDEPSLDEPSEEESPLDEKGEVKESGTDELAAAVYSPETSDRDDEDRAASETVDVEVIEQQLDESSQDALTERSADGADADDSESESANAQNEGEPAKNDDEPAQDEDDKKDQSKPEDEQAGDNPAKSDEDHGDTAGDDKASAAAEETPLARRRRMLGRRHHRGKP